MDMIFLSRAPFVTMFSNRLGTHVCEKSLLGAGLRTTSQSDVIRGHWRCHAESSSWNCWSLASTPAKSKVSCEMNPVSPNSPHKNCVSVLFGRYVVDHDELY